MPDYSDTLRLMRRTGCVQCDGTGYHGRIGLYDLLVNTDSFSRLIVSRKIQTDGSHRPATDGLRLLRMDGIQKVFQGLTDYEQVSKACQQG